MADKARFFLERGIPELKELEKKKVFTKEEIQSISKKRSDFEHRINAPRCKPADFARYAEYEMNLDALRKKRIKRLGIKLPSHISSRRIFFILERATRKFHGNIPLWMQYIGYAKKEKSTKLVMKVLTAVLRLHPAKPELWIYAARIAMEDNADTTEARSFMQRGLRFNKYSRPLWLEYAKFECVFIAKILARRQILGIDRPAPIANDEEEENFVTMDFEDENMIAVPDVVEDMDPALQQDTSLDFHALKSIDSNRALSGGVPLAIFDAAVATIPSDPTFASAFFDLFATFTSLPCHTALTSHVLSYQQTTFPQSPETAICYIRQPLIGVDAGDSGYPAALKSVLGRFSEEVGALEDKDKAKKGALYEKFTRYLQSLCDMKEMDVSVRKAVELSLVKYVRQAEREGCVTDEMKAVVVRLA